MVFLLRDMVCGPMNVNFEQTVFSLENLEDSTRLNPFFDPEVRVQPKKSGRVWPH